MKKLSAAEVQRRLQECETEYQAIKARIGAIGFICTGSLVKRWMACGKPTCRCSTDPAARHGPYYQLSWKDAGMTVSQRLRPEHARLYDEWIANRHRLESLLAQMQRVSGRAGLYLLRAADEAKLTSESPHPRRKSKHQR